LRRQHREDAVENPDARERARRATDRGEHQTLHHRQAHEMSARRPERGTDGGFVLARRAV